MTNNHITVKIDFNVYLNMWRKGLDSAAAQAWKQKAGFLSSVRVFGGISCQSYMLNHDGEHGDRCTC